MNQTTEKFYKAIPIQEIMNAPSQYPWNCLLRYQQFSQRELLEFYPYILQELVAVIRYQHSVTEVFLQDHFEKEIEESEELDWDRVKILLANRE